MKTIFYPIKTPVNSARVQKKKFCGGFLKRWSRKLKAKTLNCWESFKPRSRSTQTRPPRRCPVDKGSPDSDNNTSSSNTRRGCSAVPTLGLSKSYLRQEREPDLPPTFSTILERCRFPYPLSREVGVGVGDREINTQHLPPHPTPTPVQKST